jgi:hypothetical protein
VITRIVIKDNVTDFNTRWRKLAAILAICITLNTGCKFPPIYLAGKTPQLGQPTPSRTIPEHVPRVALRVSPHVVLKPLEKEYSAVKLEFLLYYVVQKMAEELAPFYVIQIDGDPAQVADADYVVDLDVTTEPDHGGVGRFLLIFCSALTLGILPLYQSHDLTLTAAVTPRVGHKFRTYQIEGSITEVMQTPLTWFLPLGWVLAPDRAARKVLEDMIRALFEQMERDDLFPASEK